MAHNHRRTGTHRPESGLRHREQSPVAGRYPAAFHLKLNTKWLAKIELFRVPLFGWMLRMAGDVPVDRAAPRQAARALMQCAKYLRQNCSVVFFPEGGRSPDGEVQPFNEGAFQLAIREQILSYFR